MVVLSWESVQRPLVPWLSLAERTVSSSATAAGLRWTLAAPPAGVGVRVKLTWAGGRAPAVRGSLSGVIAWQALAVAASAWLFHHPPPPAGERSFGPHVVAYADGRAGGLPLNERV